MHHGNYKTPASASFETVVYSTSQDGTYYKYYIEAYQNVDGKLQGCCCRAALFFYD
jgi:hypothetical protein